MIGGVVRLAMSMLDVDDRSVERRRNYLRENVVLSKEISKLVLGHLLEILEP
jgi:hypothetical protein